MSLPQMAGMGAGQNFMPPSNFPPSSQTGSGQMPGYMGKTAGAQPQGDLRQLWQMVTQVCSLNSCCKKKSEEVSKRSRGLLQQNCGLLSIITIRVFRAIPDYWQSTISWP